MMSEKQFGSYNVEVSKTDKVLFPGEDITKGDLIDYYERVADVMLSQVKGRPVTMHRYPDGIGEKDFFQKDIPAYFPDWIERVTVKKQGGTITHVLCQNTATLVYLANQACITFHVWLSRADSVNHPDRIVIDLDPPGDDFAPVRKIALYLRNLIDEVGLVPFVKTTGSRGLHVAAPLDRSADFDEAREFARKLAELAEERNPEETTTAQKKVERKGRIFLDTNRNAYAQTAVAPYSIRAKPGAPVATPVDWDEVEDSSLSPRKYHLRNIFQRLSHKDDPWKDFHRHARGLKEPWRKLRPRLEKE
jgi:bifunctional non-homologous end joining protein LigD